MRLADLIRELPDDDLQRLEAAADADHESSRDALVASLDASLRSYSFVKKFIGDCMPPTFSILDVLLNAHEFAIPAAGFRELVDAHTQGLVDRVAAGDLVGRDNGLRLYRRVLFEARRNDFILDSSETAILGVLRSELNVRQHEHFLVEYHADFHHLWRQPHAFLKQMSALRAHGLVFAHEGRLMLAEDVVPVIRKVLGFEMDPTARRRLFEKLTAKQLGDALAAADLRSSGSRDEKFERLLVSYIQPSEALRALSLADLKDICREANAPVTGAKEDVVDRLVEHFSNGADQPQVLVPVELPPEPRVLNNTEQFAALFTSLRGEDLTEILVGIGSSRITGAKDVKVALLARSRFSEMTLLDHLRKKELEEILERLIEAFRQSTLPTSMATWSTGEPDQS
jgi:hypothetical protein